MTCSALTLERPRWRTLPSRDELGHRADGLLDRHARVREVQVPEVDGVDAEPLQAGLGGLAGALGPRVDEDLLGVRVLRSGGRRSKTMPHLVASWTSRPLIARPTSRSLAPSRRRRRRCRSGSRRRRSRGSASRASARRRRGRTCRRRGPSRRSRWRRWSGCRGCGSAWARCSPRAVARGHRSCRAPAIGFAVWPRSGSCGTSSPWRSVGQRERGGAGPAPLAVGAERGRCASSRWSWASSCWSARAAASTLTAGRRGDGARGARRRSRASTRRWRRSAAPRSGRPGACGSASRPPARGGSPRSPARASSPASRTCASSRAATTGAARSPRCATASATSPSSGCRPTSPACARRSWPSSRARRRCRSSTGSPRATSLSVDELDRRADHVDPASTALLGRLVGGEPASVRPRADLGTGERQRRGDARAGRRRLGLLHRPGLDDRVLRAAGPRVGARWTTSTRCGSRWPGASATARRWSPPTRRSCASWPEAAAARRPRRSRSRPRSGRRRATAGRPRCRRPSRAWCARSRRGCRARAGSRSATSPAAHSASIRPSGAPRWTSTAATTVPPIPTIGCGRRSRPGEVGGLVRAQFVEQVQDLQDGQRGEGEDGSFSHVGRLYRSSVYRQP